MCKTFFITFLVVAALHSILATAQTTCTTADECKSLMKEDFKVKYNAALSEILKQIYRIIQSGANYIERNLSKGDARHTRLEELKSSAQRQIDTLNNNVEINFQVYKESTELWREMLKLNEDKRTNLEPRSQRALAELDKIYEDVFEIWLETGKIKGDIKVPGYEEIERDVQKVKNKDTYAIDGDKVSTFQRIMEFYNLKYLNFFTTKK